MDMAQYAIAAFLVESIVNLLLTIYVYEAGKPVLQSINWKVLFSILVGEVVALGFGLDLVSILGFTGAVPYLGAVLTGLVISRGSNFIHDAIVFLKNLKTGAQLDVEKKELQAKTLYNPYNPG